MATKNQVQERYLPQDDPNKLPSVFVGGSVPDYVKAGSSRGNENVASEDIAIPRLEIVQALSPIRKDNPLAVEGMLFNSVTGEVYGTEVYIVPVTYAKQFLIWKDRKKGGGFRGAWPTMDAAKNHILELDAKGLDRADDLQVAETPTHLCLMVRDVSTNPKLEQIAIAMPRSKMKVNRKWNAAIEIAGGDRFARAYKLGVTTEKNAAGEEYFNFTMQPVGYVPEPIYRQAEALYERVARAGMNIAHESVAGEEAPTGDSSI